MTLLCLFKESLQVGYELVLLAIPYVLGADISANVRDRLLPPFLDLL